MKMGHCHRLEETKESWPLIKLCDPESNPKIEWEHWGKTSEVLKKPTIYNVVTLISWFWWMYYGYIGVYTWEASEEFNGKLCTIFATCL